MTRKKTVTLEKLGNGRRLSIDMVHVGFRIRPVRSVNRVTHIRTQRDKEGGKTNTQTAASNGKRGAGVTWHRRRREEKKEKNRGYPYEKIRTTHQTIERNDATVVLLPSPPPPPGSPARSSTLTSACDRSTCMENWLNPTTSTGSTLALSYWWSRGPLQSSIQKKTREYENLQAIDH